jgi:hypothetical protein
VTVWEEIQERVRGPRAIPHGQTETVDIVNGAGMLVQTITMERVLHGCGLCGCPADSHSEILPFAPCLDCGDCIGWTVRTLPNPTRRERR